MKSKFKLTEKTEQIAHIVDVNMSTFGDGDAMDIKFCSGIKVSVQDNGNSKLLIFDRPVRVMELSQEESTKLGQSLAKGCLIAVAAERGESTSRRPLTTDKPR